ncbi:unnamed protein product [Orchesella dallaii]|uniref:ELM2 domain-containing protein n=1 Tax=Orchesella dallaii TaxID=48710 RepID=A0ABP1SA34_9HEXA
MPNQIYHQDSNADDIDNEASQSTSSGKSSRVGENYQAKLPTLIKNKPFYVERDSHHADLQWKPTTKIDESEIDALVFTAKNDFNYSEEQALGVLYYYDFNLEKARKMLPTLVPFKPDELSEEDKMFFAGVIISCEKDLKQMSTLLYRKPMHMTSIVYQYYKWKRECLMKSYIDFSDRDLIPKDPVSRLKGLLASIASSRKAERSGWIKGRGQRKAVTAGVNPIKINVDELKKMPITSQSEELNETIKELEKQVVALKIRNQKTKQRLELDRRGLPKEGAMSYYRIVFKEDANSIE